MSRKKSVDEKPVVTPLALINDEPVAGLGDDRLGLGEFANTVAAVVLGTEGPFTVGVLGDWGVGKTSLLRLVEANVDAKGGENVIPVWFNAWQYEREEHPIVPLAACIIRALEQRYPDKKSGAEFIRALRAVISGFSVNAKLKIPVLGEVGVEFDNEKAVERHEELKKQAVDSLLDQSLYDNAFQLLAELSKRGDDSEDRPRIVVFIDDLDRCLPENALHLLESIKLVLAQPGFLFVLAVDKRIVEGYLDRRYKEKYGLEDYHQGQSYLDKIIQLPFPIPAHVSRFENFVGRMLERDELKNLAGEFEPLKFLIGPACNFNPREVVRFFNRMLIDRHIWNQINEDEDEKFDAGAFAVARSLQNQSEKIYRMLMRNDELCEELKGAESVRDRLQRMRGEAAKIQDASTEKVGKIAYWSSSHEDVVIDILGRPNLCALLDTEPGRRWLTDGQLRKRIEEFLQVQRADAPETDSASIIDMAIRKAINKAKGQLTDEDRNGITELNLYNEPITELRPLKELASLQELGLSGTQVSELEPLKGLASLQRLDLNRTQVSELEPLKGLASLQTLGLNRTRVSELGPLKGLVSLQGLGLNRTRVSELEPLKGLASLQTLYLDDTRVSELEPLKGLASLQRLDLNRTQVSELEPLKGLASLQGLDLSDTRVSELEPLKGLASLQRLDLNRTRVSELESLKGLASLQRLGLSGTRVSELEPLKGLASLQTLDLSGTQVSELEPLKGLVSLQRLDLNRTRVSELEPLKGLASLQTLGLSGTQVSDEQVADLKAALPNLTVEK